MAEGYLTSSQAARILGVSRRAVLHAVAAGKLCPACRMPGGALRFASADVEHYAQWRTLERQKRVRARRVAGEPVRLRDAADAETRFHATVLGAVGQTVLAMDVDRAITYWNRAAEAMFGWEAAEVLGRGIAEVTQTSASAEDTARVMSVLARGETWSGELEVSRRDGTVFPALVTATPIVDPAGKLGGIVVISVDLTARRQADERLRQSEQDFRLLAENSSDLITRLTPDLVVIYASPSARQVLGFDPEELKGRPIREVIHEDDWDAVAQTAERALAQPVSESVAYRHLRADGTYVWVETTGRAKRDERTGQVLEIQADTRDISARKRAEDLLRDLAHERLGQARVAEALSEASAALAAVAEPASLHGSILGQMARVVPCSSAHVLAYRDGWAVVVGAHGEPHLPSGYRMGPLAGIEGFFPRSAEHARLLSETRDAAGWPSLPPWVGENELRSAIVVPLIVQGETYGCLLVGSTTPGVLGPREFQVVRAFSERIVQAVWNARLQQLEQDRTRATQYLDSLRSEFVAIVSHELRTPLAAVLGFAEVLEARWTQLTDAQRRLHVQRIVMAANRQQRLIDDILRMSALESESFAAVSREVPLLEVVSRAMDVVNASYPSQRIEADGPLDLAVAADPTHLEQVLVNLLDNAAKYSPEGSPIEVHWVRDGGMAVIRVYDHGPGIPEQGRGVLFSRFGRLPGSRARAGHVGMGLGLFLGRKYAEAMGGSLDLESSDESGSVFGLRLRLA